jgi:hypothetical protein
MIVAKAVGFSDGTDEIDAAIYSLLGLTVQF